MAVSLRCVTPPSEQMAERGREFYLSQLPEKKDVPGHLRPSWQEMHQLLKDNQPA